MSLLSSSLYAVMKLIIMSRSKTTSAKTQVREAIVKGKSGLISIVK